MNPELEAATVMRDIATLTRVVAAHFSEPEAALAFARLCDSEAGTLVPVPSPVSRLTNLDNVVQCGAAFVRDKFRAWRDHAALTE